MSGGNPLPEQLQDRLTVRVAETRDEASDVRVFSCEQVGGEPDASAPPGSHIDVHIAPGLVRQYSLLSSGSGRYVFAVKKEPRGRGGSVHLFDRVFVGQLLDVSVPRSHFSLDETAPHSVLIAGGIGITPIYSMYRRLSEAGSSWELHYASRSQSDALFFDEFNRHPQFRLYVKSQTDVRSLELESVIARAPEDSHFYCCGPPSMLDAFRTATRSLAPDRVHIEQFSPVPKLTTGTAFKVKLQRSGDIIDIPSDRTILDVLVGRGTEVPFSCREGVCGACEVDVVEGTPDHRDAVLSEKEKRSGRSIIVCCSRSTSYILTLDL